MGKKMQYNILIGKKLFPMLLAAILILLPVEGTATQLHTSQEGIITHQMGHLFFLFSMVVLIFTITEKKLDKQKGWRLIQYSAAFFILWNIDTVTAHFFDNQIHVVKIENISLDQIRIIASNDSTFLAWFYYVLKLDHLLCVPAMLFFFKGLSSLASDQRQKMLKRDVS